MMFSSRFMWRHHDELYDVIMNINVTSLKGTILPKKMQHDD